MSKKEIVEYILAQVDREQKRQPPYTVISKARQEFEKRLLSGEVHKDDFSGVNDGEKVILVISGVDYSEERASKTTGGFAGVSYKVTKRTSVRAGGFQAGSKVELTELDSGSLIITDQRVIFDGKTNFKERKLAEIAKYDVSGNTLVLSIKGKQKKEFYSNIRDYSPIDIDLVPQNKDVWEEDTYRWQLTSSDLKKLIAKIKGK